MKVAAITGVTGQDGSYLVDLLLSKGYTVHGLLRQSTQFVLSSCHNLSHLNKEVESGQLQFHFGDITDASRMRSFIDAVQPDEVYNLAAQSHVGLSFEQPINTTSSTALGPLNLLEAIKRSNSKIKFLQASSSEMFGKVLETPQSELTGFYPRSPYGCAKVYGHYITQNYREAYGIFACSSICFNHESERRGINFLTRKVTKAVSRISLGLQSELVLGNTDAKRDWGYAPDYVKAMWMMLQRESPEDFVIGTGECHTVQEFIEESFKLLNLDHKKYVKYDTLLMRPSEVDTLRANIHKARSILGWYPKTNFHELIAKMIEHDLHLASKE
jgi:GDPmannose 4,6-dehydratase